MNHLLQIASQTVNIGNQHFEFPSVAIQNGELVGLIGQSGSGKSILLRQLAGLMETKSPLTYNGTRKSFIFSRGGLFQHQTVRENLTLPTLFTKVSISKQHIDDILNEWNLVKIQHHFPAQLNPQATKITQIARTILLQPDIAFIEKPLVGLSMGQAERLIQWITEHTAGGRTVVYSEENRRIFHKLNPRLIDLGGGHDNLRTVMHR